VCYRAIDGDEVAEGAIAGGVATVVGEAVSLGASVAVGETLTEGVAVADGEATTGDVVGVVAVPIGAGDGVREAKGETEGVMVTEGVIPAPGARPSLGRGTRVPVAVGRAVGKTI